VQGSILSNRYLIAEEIGIGGMGSVYRATDLRTGGDVAVKVPHAFLARNPEYMERLRREAQIAASVYSPRVVRVMDFYEHEGVPYLVMEYVPGDTLADVSRERGRFSLAETLAVGLEVARALDAAHTKGVIHRDLKPQNIKLVDGEVKVLDFGIAKGEGFANVTAASVFMGTPEYCAPERASGEGDIRSDIYSLGIILFEMYEGQLPFQAAAPLALIRKHETEPPPPLTGDVPEAFQAIISRCLAKRPADRYESPRELVQALRALIESGAITAPTTIPPGGFTPTIRQPRLTDSGPVSPSDATPAEATESPETDHQAVAESTPPTTPPPPRRGRRLLPIAGIIAAVLLGGAFATAILSGVLGQEDGSQTATAPGTVVATVTGNGTPRPGDTPAGPLLLALGEQRTVPTASRVEFDLTEAGCQGVKTILQPTSIRADPSGRVVVGYTVETPRVQGVECVVNYTMDANCSCMVLQTRLPSGSIVQARNTGGSGVAATGADDIYGAGVFKGEWWFDRGVDLSGEELSLIRYPPNSDVPLFRLTLLRR
jgi:serine/threonine protein kinase